MKKPLIPVSDHALVRYFEHVLGVDMEAQRRRIGRRIDRAVGLGASSVVIDGFRYMIADGTVTTVVQVSRPDVRTGCQRQVREDDPLGR